MNPSYRYRATVLEVHDGDTIRVRVDLGFEVSKVEWIRVADVYCPELDEPGGPEAREFTKRQIDPVPYAWTDPVIIETRKTKAGKDKQSFARYVADVTLPDGRDLAMVIDKAGHGTRTREA